MDIYWIYMDIFGYLRWISFSGKLWICFKKTSRISEDIQWYPSISNDIQWYPMIFNDIQGGKLPDGHWLWDRCCDYSTPPSPRLISSWLLAIVIYAEEILNTGGCMNFLWALSQSRKVIDLCSLYMRAFTYIIYQNHQTQQPATYLPHQAACRELDKMIGIIIWIVTGVTQEGAVVKASLFSLSSKLVHHGPAHNWRLHNIEFNIRG